MESGSSRKVISVSLDIVMFSHGDHGLLASKLDGDVGINNLERLLQRNAASFEGTAGERGN